MSDNERFRRDVGLDQSFEDARQRWHESLTSPERRRQPKPIPPSLQKLRERFEREMLQAQGQSDTEFDLAFERLNVLSPWYAPPTDREVIDTRTAVQQTLTAVSTAIRTLELREKQGIPWYADRSDVPGFDRSLVDEFGPGNAMRGEHDPIPVLLVSRDLLANYLQRLEAARPPADPKARNRLVQSVVDTLLGAAGITAKEICEVLKSKGVETTPHAINQVAGRRRTAPDAPPQPRRGGAPRGPRKTKQAAGSATKP